MWRTGNTAQRQTPVAHMDFMFIDAHGIGVAKREHAAHINLVGYDAASGYPMAVAVTSKTPSKYLCSSMVQRHARRLRVDRDMHTSICAWSQIWSSGQS
eukprot:6473690-Amphidinium_carterae.1